MKLVLVLKLLAVMLNVKHILTPYQEVVSNGDAKSCGHKNCQSKQA